MTEGWFAYASGSAKGHTVLVWDLDFNGTDVRWRLWQPGFLVDFIKGWPEGGVCGERIPSPAWGPYMCALPSGHETKHLACSRKSVDEGKAFARIEIRRIAA